MSTTHQAIPVSNDNSVWSVRILTLAPHNLCSSYNVIIGQNVAGEARDKVRSLGNQSTEVSDGDIVGKKRKWAPKGV